MIRPGLATFARCRLFLATLMLGGGALFGAFAGSNGISSPAGQRFGAPNVPATIEPDGTLDSSFDAGTFTNGQVWSSALQPDGKLLIGGEFSKVHGVDRLGIARLNADETLDTSFVPPAGIDVNAQKIIVQPDGKILSLSKVSGTVRVIRLNTDGSLDSS